MLKVIDNETQTLATIGAPANGAAIDVSRARTFSAQVNVTVNTASPATFTANATTNVCTATAHGLVTGSKVQVSNGGGGLPGGLSGGTDYYVIKLTADTFKLADSLVHAQAGTEIDITTAGTGTQTVTATSLAGATLQLQKSNDGTNWANQGSTVSVTGTGGYFIDWNDTSGSVPSCRYARIAYSLTAGSFSASSIILVKGDIN